MSGRLREIRLITHRPCSEASLTATGTALAQIGPLLTLISVGFVIARAVLCWTAPA
jgi:hypothetical protein